MMWSQSNTSRSQICDLACLAMAAGISIEEAMAVMGDKKGVGSAAL